MSINAEGFTGVIYYETSVLENQTILYSDALLTTPINPNWVFIKTNEEHFLEIMQAEVIGVYLVGSPC